MDKVKGSAVGGEEGGTLSGRRRGSVAGNVNVCVLGAAVVVVVVLLFSWDIVVGERARRRRGRRWRSARTMVLCIFGLDVTSLLLWYVLAKNFGCQRR